MNAVKIYKVTVLPTLLYGSESDTIKIQHKQHKASRVEIRSGAVLD